MTRIPIDDNNIDQDTDEQARSEVVEVQRRVPLGKATRVVR